MYNSFRTRLTAVTAAVIVLAFSGLSNGDWSGFHGAEKQGHADSDAGPLHWSSSQNVVWKTAIPGRGHSSPIVAGDAAYVTTSYERGRSAAGETFCRYAVFVFALLFVTTGIRSSMSGLGRGGTPLQAAGRCVRVFLFVQMLAATAILALFGRHLFNPDDAAMRHWLVSIMMFFLCVAAASLLVPWKSRQHLVAGALCLLFAALSGVVFKIKGFSLDLGSMKGMATVAVATSPVVLAGMLSAAHLLSRGRASHAAQMPSGESRRFSILRSLPVVLAGGFAAVAPFVLLLYRASGYQMPDRYLLENRVHPEMGWRAVAVFAAVAGVATAASIWKARRTGSAGRFPWLSVSFALALCLAGTYLVGIAYTGKPKEFVRALVCVDAGSGKISWICEGLTAGWRTESRVVTHASPTPVADGRRIYAYFGEDGLMCVDPNGALLWKRAEPMFRCHFGAGTSPIARDDSVVIVSDVTACDDLSSSIASFEGSSGRTLWQKTRESDKEYATYNTPLIMSLDGRDVVVVHGWKGITGYDLRTGEELWSYDFDHAGKHLVAGMICDEERLYVIGARRVVALSLSKLAAGREPSVWSRPVPDEKSSTPVLVDGLLFLVTESGVAHCLESDTGEIVWKERLGGKHFSSVVSMAGRVFFTNEVGQTTVVAAGRKFNVLARNRLGEAVYASLTPTGDRLLVRTASHLYCIGEPKP